MKTLNILLFFVFISIVTKAQLINVTGCVTNSERGEAVANASVFELNSEIGTITNDLGNYRLFLKSGMQEIQFSEPDFKPYKLSLKIASDTTLNIQLTPLEQKSGGKNNNIQANSGNSSKKLNKNKLRFKRF